MVSAGTRSIGSYGRRTVLILAVVLMLLPVVAFFYWLILLSFRSDLINNLYPPAFLPKGLTLRNFRQVIEDNNLARDGLNSVIVAVGSTVLGLMLGAPAA